MNGTKQRPVWPEAEFVAEPVPRADKPRLLVRRRHSGLVSASANTDFVCLDGLPAISLFTGAGGIDIGLERSGFTTLLQHEWSEFPCLTLMANRPRYFRHAALIQGDLRQTPTSLLLQEAGLRVGECYLIAGGPPCQGFSSSNSRAVKHQADKRNDLVYEFLRVVNEARPSFFMFENVKGILQFNHGEYVRRFLARAHDSYYELVYGLVDCAEYGVPQHRCRFICMGTRRDIAEIDGHLAGLPKPEHFGKRDIETLTAIERLPLFDREESLLRQAPGVRYFPDRPFICNPDPTGKEDCRSKSFIEFYRQLAATEPDRMVVPP